MATFLTTTEAAAHLGIEPERLVRDRDDHSLRVPFVQFGKDYRYERGQLDEWRAKRGDVLLQPSPRRERRRPFWATLRAALTGPFR